MEVKYDRKIFGLSWMIISGILEIWWLIAIIVSAVYADTCDGWEAIDANAADWFILIVLIILFFGQFCIGELMGLIEYQKSQNKNTAFFPKWMITTFQVILFVYIVLNILALGSITGEEGQVYKDCMTGQIMLVTIVVNLVYSIICFIFSFWSLPLADVDAPDNQNKMEKISQKDEDDEEQEALVVDAEQKESAIVETVEVETIDTENVNVENVNVENVDADNTDKQEAQEEQEKDKATES